MRTDELAAKTTSSSCSTRFLFSRARKKTGRLFFITCIRDRQPMPPVVVVGRASFSFPPKILMWDNPHVASQLAAPVLSLFGIQATTSIRCSTFIISSEENNIRPPFEWKPVPTAFFFISCHVVGGCGRTRRPTEGKRRGGNVATAGIHRWKPPVAGLTTHRHRQMPSFSAEWHLDRSVLLLRQLRERETRSQDSLSLSNTNGRTDGKTRSDHSSCVVYNNI